MHQPQTQSSLFCASCEDHDTDEPSARVPLKSAALRCLLFAKADAAGGALDYLAGAPGAFMARQSPDWMKAAQK